LANVNFKALDQFFIVALIVMFQGSIALPLAFWLERRLGSGLDVNSYRVN
jgi:hypothetical protein